MVGVKKRLGWKVNLVYDKRTPPWLFGDVVFLYGVDKPCPSIVCKMLFDPPFSRTGWSMNVAPEICYECKSIEDCHTLTSSSLTLTMKADMMVLTLLNVLDAMFHTLNNSTN